MVVCGDDHQVDLRSKADSGFRFLYALNESMKEMIEKWSKQDLIKDLERCQRDRAGKIEKNKDISLTHALDACSYYIALKHPIRKKTLGNQQW